MSRPRFENSMQAQVRRELARWYHIDYWCQRLLCLLGKHDTHEHCVFCGFNIHD